MTVSFRSYSKILLGLFLILSFCVVEVDAQTRRKRRARRAKPAVAKPVITNPTIAPPATTNENSSTGDVKIISTTDPAVESAESAQAKKSNDNASSPLNRPSGSNQDEMQKTITTLTDQVNRLNDKLTQMQEDDRYQLDMERLMRAEQRAEQLRSQLFDTQSKMADLEVKLEQIDYALKPENIERATLGVGSMRPEETREARRRQLLSERSRLQAQLKLLETSKARLEVASANADAEVDLLRAKLQQRREQMDAAPRKP